MKSENLILQKNKSPVKLVSKFNRAFLASFFSFPHIVERYEKNEQSSFNLTDRIH